MVVAPMWRPLPLDSIPFRSPIFFRLTTRFGDVSCCLRLVIRSVPPERISASPQRSLRRPVASSSVLGAAYSNDFIKRSLLSVAEALELPDQVSAADRERARRRHSQRHSQSQHRAK